MGYGAPLKARRRPKFRQRVNNSDPRPYGKEKGFFLAMKMEGVTMKSEDQIKEEIQMIEKLIKDFEKIGIPVTGGAAEAADAVSPR